MTIYRVVQITNAESHWQPVWGIRRDATGEYITDKGQVVTHLTITAAVQSVNHIPNAVVELPPLLTQRHP